MILRDRAAVLRYCEAVSRQSSKQSIRPRDGAILHANIDPALIEHLDRARAMVGGVTRTRYISELLTQSMSEVDEQGVPTWWDTAPRQQALPLGSFVSQSRQQACMVGPCQFSPSHPVHRCT